MGKAKSQPRVIIGVHGLANKPPKEELADSWRESLVEGLENIEVKKPKFEFRMVYWADLLYCVPLHRREYFEYDPLYNNEPYRPADKGALKKYEDSWLDELRARGRGMIGSTFDSLKRDFNVDSLADWLLGRLMKDLSFYYENRQIGNRAKPCKPEPTQDVLRREVSQAVKDEQVAGKKILLIAHSMGSILAYDALRGIGREPGNKVEVACLATIGSPLGLPHVKHKIIEEWKKRPGFKDDPQLRTPTVVTEQWVNFADRKDPVAADVHLADDYGPNQKGIAVRDDLVLNDYYTLEKPETDGKKAKAETKRKPNHHKSYGYLRTPEMAECVRDFLGL